MELIHYLADYMWQTWAVVAVICLILELMNGDFFIMCFAIGGVCAAIASAFTDSLIVQILVFVVFSLLSLVFVRPKALKYLHKGEDSRLSNADALIGREGKVSEDIPADGFGRVLIDGDDWKACSTDNEAIAKGTKVRVVKMESIIITVEKIS